MISGILVFVIAAGAARAAVVPTAPGPGQVFDEGGNCSLSWNLDTTGKWTSFTVDLMSGSNLAMQPVTNVFKGRDGTKGDTTFTWKCPQVTPHSAIYFYQFTQPGAETTWTTRLAIASPSGEVTPPANPTQPGGAAIPWGVGHLAGSGVTSANQTAAASSPDSNSTAAVAPPTASNSTNPTTPALTAAANSATGMNGTSALTSTPKQSTSSSASTSTSTVNKAPTSNANTASASTPRTSPTPSSDASAFTVSMTLMAMTFVTLFIVA